MLIPPKSIDKLTTSQCNLRIFREISEDGFRIYMKMKRSVIVNAILQKTKNEEFILLNFKTTITKKIDKWNEKFQKQTYINSISCFIMKGTESIPWGS